MLTPRGGRIVAVMLATGVLAAVIPVPLPILSFLPGSTSFSTASTAAAQTGTTFQDDLELDGLLNSIFQGSDTVVLDETDLEAAIPMVEVLDRESPAETAAIDGVGSDTETATPVDEAAGPPIIPLPKRRPTAPVREPASESSAPSGLNVGDETGSAAETGIIADADSLSSEDGNPGDDVAYADAEVAEMILSLSSDRSAETSEPALPGSADASNADDGIASVRGSSGTRRTELPGSSPLSGDTAASAARTTEAGQSGATGLTSDEGTADATFGDTQVSTRPDLSFREEEWIPVPMDRPKNVPEAIAVIAGTTVSTAADSGATVETDQADGMLASGMGEPAAVSAQRVQDLAETPEGESAASSRSGATPELRGSSGSDRDSLAAVSPTDIGAAASSPTSSRELPTSATTSQPRPPIDPQCPLRLERLGAVFMAQPDFVDDRGCQNQGAIAIESFGSGVSLADRVVLACPVAEATALWLRNVVQTESLETFGTRLVSLSNVGGYSCRMRAGGRISEHGFANAIDIGTFHFKDGRRVHVKSGWRPNGTAMGDLTSDWFESINAGACDYFQIVLNPNSDAAHADHFHFDLGPWKSCD